MAINTDALKDQWVQNSLNTRVMLVQATHSAGVEYLSTHAVTVGGQQYRPVLNNPFQITQRLDVLEFGSDISYSDVEVYNGTGLFDSWLTRVWTNQPIVVYVGELSGTNLLTDFVEIFRGTIATLDSRDRNTLNFTVRSNLNNLNRGVVGSALGNYYQGSIVPTSTIDNPNKAAIKPLIFGEVHNITPLLTDRTMLEYMVCDGAIEQIIEVRDNGVPVSFSTSTTVPGIPAGSFRLKRTPVGQITCDVQGLQQSTNFTTGALQSSYINNTANIIATIINKYIKPSFTTLQFDGDSLSLFTAAQESTSYACGIYITDRFNAFELCNELAKGAGLVLLTTNDGKLSLRKPTKAAGIIGTPIAIDDNKMVFNTLSIAFRNELSAGVRLQYARNWTVQQNLLTGIPDEHKALFSLQYDEVTSKNATIEASAKAEQEIAPEPTYLIRKVDAQAVADIKRNIVSEQSTVYQTTVIAEYLLGTKQLSIGTKVSLTSSRFGLNNTAGVVVSTTPNWKTGTLDIEVLV